MIKIDDVGVISTRDVVRELHAADGGWLSEPGLSPREAVLRFASELTGISEDRLESEAGAAPGTFDAAFLRIAPGSGLGGKECGGLLSLLRSGLGVPVSIAGAAGFVDAAMDDDAASALLMSMQEAEEWPDGASFADIGVAVASAKVFLSGSLPGGE